jgi:hypothetical protein
VILEIIPEGGIGRGPPLVIAATQIVIRADDGTPICVAAHFGPERAYAVEKAGDPDFQRALRAMGIRETVICDRVELPKPPPGARLVADPRRSTT